MDKALTSTDSTDNPAVISRTPEKKRGINRLIEITMALLGMSRAPVAVFVVAHAGLASIFALGKIPDINTIAIGILACLAGTGALIGLNDLLDVELDRRKMAYQSQSDKLDLGSTFIHHPIAKEVISIWMGIAWVAGLSIASLYLITLLRQRLWPIFLLIAVCVVLYSKLSELTFLKFLAVASAVTLGALAGWFAVGGTVNPTFILFTVWTFIWEIGGRNIPNDFNDLEEDKPLGIKTIPVVFGELRAAQVVIATLIITFLISVFLVFSTPFTLIFKSGAIGLGVFLLIIPGLRLLKDPRPQVSVKLYNRSALYPLFLLLVLMLSLYI